MINRLMTTGFKKKQKLRNNGYYDIQEIFDDLYDKSKNKKDYKFYKLMDIITSKQNIELAYRNIKKNTGSKTSGVNKHTIGDIARVSNGDLVEYIKRRLQNYKPHKVHRVEIPKGNGKTRPLGIPTIEDRIIQQCIKQVLEPICEAKFYNHSYGFRPNRSTHHAIAKTKSLMQKNKLHYVVDIDIKGFFDNVNHGKLLKQMWSLGIQDKQLLCIISKMLKAPIEGIGIPIKGTPQGGILSPLLSNIVLNELDWWIAGQWEYFETKHNYDTIRDNKVERSHKYRALRKTKMKEIYIVRYADDFKIFCKDYKTANKIFKATKMWLKERLSLEISEEKSKIVNLNKNYSEYLGFKLRLKPKGNQKVVKSHISDKAKKRIENKLKEAIINIKKETTIENVNKYNSTVIGLHNYYKVATDVNEDFSKISYVINKSLKNRTNKIRSKTGEKSECYKKFYGKYNFKTTYIRGVALFPIAGITTQPPMHLQQKFCNYTKEGRKFIHDRQQSVSTLLLRYLMENPIPSESIEYNDNRISLYVGQNGICPISKDFLEIGNMECHHKIPKAKGGKDEYKNLIFLRTEVHKLIHATDLETIEKYRKKLDLNKQTLKKLNRLRVLVGNSVI
ncbi:group II intron reverse transcriptase/maturase [Paraclostridium bifermentans]|uniref:group II intron reverse transcriptase/maturase n=1 Tax=Paraclostridium bifermentans TaxID=1490 RepID=UPI001D02E98F|nr:group II intron reverse transcriptase/maturase [Paraclostridium bifermentans]